MKLALALAFIVLSSTETHAQSPSPTGPPRARPTTTSHTSSPTGPPASRPIAASTELKPWLVTCINDKSFVVNNKLKKNCGFVVRKPKRRTKLCQRGNVRDACPSSCGIDGCCADSSAFLLKNKNDKMKSCRWVNKRKMRKALYCERARVKSECISTCDNCQDEVVLAPPVGSLVAPPVGSPVELDDG